MLWEHVKYKVNKSTEDKKSDKGKHAAGVFERQDAYLYGHPEGRKKRYRSPADFFPHVLWLATDKEGDRRNCSCKICSPDGDEEPADDVAKAEVVIPFKRETKPAPTLGSVPAAAPKSIHSTPINCILLTSGQRHQLSLRPCSKVLQPLPSSPQSKN